MIFKLYDCDIGVTVNGVNYDFTHVDSVTIDNPQRVRLTRGANLGNKTGISYREGVKEAIVVTVPVIELSRELHDVLKAAFDAQTRLDFFVIARSDGSHKTAKNAVLSQEPMQLTLDDSPESMNVTLIFETFDIGEVHKS